MRKIIILPSFASSHLLECSILNWIDVIEPDIIVINEGLFPGGIENKKEIDDEFREKWCLEDSDVGFDIEETFKLKHKIELNLVMTQGISWKPKIMINPIKYSSLDVNECFLEAISTFVLSDFEPELGDLIFPLEPDVLLHQDDKEKIQSLISQLKPGEGLQCEWKDFIGTQFFIEGINIQNPKFRRFAYCFDNVKNYRSAMDAFMSQNYSKLKKTTEFFVFHYPWMVSGKWKELRYELIYRSDETYWKNFDIGLEWIKLKSEIFVKRQQKGNLKYEEPDPVMIRPSRNDEGRYAKFVNISHPKHIQSHKNFIK